MRVRITRRPEGDVDGFPLSGFSPGKIYDMNASIATYLIVMGWATAVADYPPARIIPMNLTRELGNAVKRATQKETARHAKKEADRAARKTARRSARKKS
jgi:hypothetical protein